MAFAGIRDGRSTIEVHDALDGSLESRLPGPAASRIRFSPDGGGIVGEGAGRVIERWDIAKRRSAA